MNSRGTRKRKKKRICLCPGIKTKRLIEWKREIVFILNYYIINCLLYCYYVHYYVQSSRFQLQLYNHN